MAETSYDLIVIGGGPGGYVAAIRAAQLGMKTAVVEREHMGGICLNWGCIPTKALLRSAEVLRHMQHAREFGLSADNPKADLPAVVKRSRRIAGQLNSGVKHLMKKNKIDVIDGHGRLDGKNKVAVERDGKATGFRARHIVLATGARPRELPGLEADGKLVWNYRHAMVPEDMPKSLLVIGSGAIGIEFASFYATLGAEVTVVEIVDRIVPVEDPEVSAFLQKSMEKQGIKFRLSASVEKLERSKTNVKATIRSGDTTDTLTVDRVISAVGISPNVENIGLEGTRIEQIKGHIKTGPYLETGEPGVYAIGDVTAPPWLAHKASHEAIICVEKIAGLDVHPMDSLKIPGCTYCHPQVASIGLTEPKAREKGYDVRIGRFPFIGNGKAIALGDTEGFVKTVFDGKTGELLGAHMVGAEVTELIQGYSVAKTLETTEEDLMHAIFPHPTLSEMMHESVLDAFGRVIHV